MHFHAYDNGSLDKPAERTLTLQNSWFICFCKQLVGSLALHEKIARPKQTRPSQGNTVCVYMGAKNSSALYLAPPTRWM